MDSWITDMMSSDLRLKKKVSWSDEIEKPPSWSREDFFAELLSLIPAFHTYFLTNF